MTCKIVRAAANAIAFYDLHLHHDFSRYLCSVSGCSWTLPTTKMLTALLENYFLLLSRNTKAMCTMPKTKMVEQLIVEFPTHRNRSSRSVRFDETSELHIIHNEDIHRQDLWYSKSDYSRMKRAIKKSARKVRKMTSAGLPVNYSGGGGSSDECLIGIEHLLSSATVPGL